MKRILNRIFTFISSIKCTIVLLVMFLLTILADVMERGIISFVRGMRLPGESFVGNVLNGYFAGDVHSSSWFTGLMILFTLNLLACMVKHIPETLRAMSLNSLAEAHAMPSSPLFQDAFTVSGLRDGFYQGLYRLLAENIARPSAHHSATRSIFFCQRGRLHHGGFYLAHSGLLIVLAGGILGSSSLSGEMCLREGESDDRIFFEENGNPCFRKLDYAIRLDECDPLDSPSENGNRSHKPYRSAVTLLSKDQERIQGVLEGYRTLARDGIRIRQSSPPGKDSHEVMLSIHSKRGGGKRRTCVLRRYQCYSIPETGHTVRLKDIFFSPHSGRVSLQHALSASDGAPLMVELEVYGNDGSLRYQPHVTAHAGNRGHPWDKEYEFLVSGVEAGAPRSGCMRLIISTEPGGGLIWAGAGIAIAGFSLMFLLSHQKIWVALEKDDGDYCVTVAGWTSRNPDILRHYAGLIRGLA